MTPPTVGLSRGFSDKELGEKGRRMINDSLRTPDTHDSEDLFVPSDNSAAEDTRERILKRDLSDKKMLRASKYGSSERSTSFRTRPTMQYASGAGGNVSGMGGSSRSLLRGVSNDLLPAGASASSGAQSAPFFPPHLKSDDSLRRMFATGGSSSTKSISFANNELTLTDFGIPDVFRDEPRQLDLRPAAASPRLEHVHMSSMRGNELLLESEELSSEFTTMQRRHVDDHFDDEYDAPPTPHAPTAPSALTLSANAFRLREKGRAPPDVGGTMHLFSQAGSDSSIRNGAGARRPERRRADDDADFVVSNDEADDDDYGGRPSRGAHTSSSASRRSKSSQGSSTNKSKWTDEECELLAIAVEKHGNKWIEVAKMVPGRKNTQCLQKWTKLQRRRGPFTETENAMLRESVLRVLAERGASVWFDDELSTDEWKRVTDELGGFRRKDQVKERWCNYMHPNILKGGWTAAEDDRIYEFVEQMGTRWADIARRVSEPQRRAGTRDRVPWRRTENSIKGRYGTIRKSLAKPWQANEVRTLTDAYAAGERDLLRMSGLLKWRTPRSVRVKLASLGMHC